MKILRVSCGVLSLLLGLCTSLLAQTETARLSGRITDPSGAVIPHAIVEAINNSTNLRIKTETNDSGLYYFPSLPPGTYRVVVSKDGFKQVIQADIVLQVQDVLTLNFGLQVGSVNEAVTVTGGAPVVNTQTADVSTVVDQSYVQNMPLNGRSFQDLILLTPGTTTMTPQATQVGLGGHGSGEFSVNGQRTESNNYTVDGVSANVGVSSGFGMINGGTAPGALPASTASGTTQALVSVEDLQEFRVLSSTYSAEYGRVPGGQFAFVTKSGTNQWHGSAYDYLRNGALDAPDWFNDYQTIVEPALHQNDFGGTIGGPVKIPRAYNGTDKTFLFVSYEGLRLISPQPAVTTVVPSLALRAGAPAPLDQVLNAFPVPNGKDFGNGLAPFKGSWSNPSSIDAFSIRFDHTVKDRATFFFRFADTESSSAFRFGGPGTTVAPSQMHSSDYTLRSYTAGVTTLLTNRLSDEFRLNYTSNKTTGRDTIDSFGGSRGIDLLQLAGLGPDAEAQIGLSFDTFNTGVGQGTDHGAQRQWNLVDNVTFSAGQHQLKFGVDYRRLMPIAILSNPQVAYIYSDQGSVLANSTSFVDWQSYENAYPLYTNFSAFAQDDWQVWQRLKVSLGLRWDVNPAPSVTQGKQAFTLAGSGPDTWALSPPGTPLWKTTWFNFAPRLGAAYMLHSREGSETVLRGGFGVFFDTGQQQGALGFNGPGFAAFNFTGGPFPGTPSFPTITGTPADCFGCAYGFYPHLQLPYTLEWNTSVEQALGKSQVITVSYVAAHASRLLQSNLFFPPNNPNGIFFVNFVQNGLTSDYQSGQVQFKRRLSHGLSSLASYTWSHCLDYGSSNQYMDRQRGNCDVDVRHSFSAAMSYDLPKMAHQGVWSAMLSYWGIDSRVTARSSFPVSLLGNPIFDPLTGKFIWGGLNLVQHEPVYIYGAECAELYNNGLSCPGGRAINPRAFIPDPSFTEPGTAPRNFARGFGAWQMNLAVRREFPLQERLKLQFRFEAFNLFNHPNFGTIAQGYCSPDPISPNFSPGCTFGQAFATLANSLNILSPLYQMGGPRSMQFALKLMF